MAAPINNDDQGKGTSALKDDSSNENKNIDRSLSFIMGTAGISLLCGFGASMYAARRKDPLTFKKLLPNQNLPDNGTMLATKALAYATVISITSCGVLVYGVFKLFGADNFSEFNAKLREYIPKKESKGRTEFKDLKDLADYLVSESRQEDIRKKKAATKDQS
ncbi:hypothetical protein ACF0H5_008304 [Mactra antiquata]